MDRDELRRRNDLALSNEWKQIRSLLLERIVQLSKGCSTPELLQGALIILDEPSNWIASFEAELRKVHKERNN